MKVFKKFVGAVVFLAVSLSLAVSADCAYAAEQPDYRMDIYPAQKGLGMIKPGDSYSDEFTLENSGKFRFDYKVSFTPYSVVGEHYDPKYDDETQYTDMAKWITTDHSEGSLESGETVKIKYTVTVPEGTHGGAQAGTIMVTMQDEVSSDVTGVQTIRRLGYLLYGNVDGEVTKTGKILENKIPTFLFKPPILGTSVVENTGNVYTVAKYSLQVFPLFSDEEVYTNEEEPENSVIFPETKRYNEIKWEGAPHLGIFRVRQTVKIFDEESVTEKIVFLCPLWFLFIVLLLIFCIIFWIVSRALKRKREA